MKPSLIKLKTDISYTMVLSKNMLSMISYSTIYVNKISKILSCDNQVVETG